MNHLVGMGLYSDVKTKHMNMFEFQVKMEFNTFILLSFLQVVSSQIYLPCNIIPRSGCTCLHPKQPIVRCEAMGLTDVPRYPRLSEAHTISFSYNSISTLHSGTFDDSVKTKTLLLGHNRLSNLGEDSLEPFENTIKRIDLNDNLFTQVPHLFHRNSGNRFRYMIELNLAGNQIRYLAVNSFRTMPRLKVLFLDRNPISFIPWNNWIGLSRLQILGLGVTNVLPITSIVLTPMANLKFFSVSGAQPATLTAMDSLLDGPLANINHLALHDMNFEDHHFRRGIFPVKYIYSLYSLSLKNNNLTRIPKQIERLKKLKKLDLSGNNITIINSNLEVLPVTLEEIYLANNSMQYVNKDIFLNLNHLKILDLRDNNLPAIEWSSSMIRRSFTPEMTLELGGNPWMCTCRNRWLKTLVRKEITRQNGHLQLYEIYNTLYCTSPTNARTELVVNVSKNEFACSEVNEIDDILRTIE